MQNEVNLGIPQPAEPTDWSALPKKLRKKIQRQYMKQLRKPANAAKTANELLKMVGEKLDINFQISE